MDPFVLTLFLRTLDSYYNEELIKNTLDLLINCKFRLIREEGDEIHANAGPGISPALQHEIDMFLAHQRDELDIQAHYLGEIELSFTLFLEEGQLRCWTYIEDIMDAGDLDAAKPMLIDIYQDLCRIWNPFYGYKEYSGGVHLNREQTITEQKVSHLYAVNLFGPELVQTLGRDRILSAPAWKITKMENDGIFLVPVNPNSVGGAGYTLKKVADHLGLNTPQAPGEEWDEWDEDEE